MTLDDLLRPEKLSILRAAFFEPNRLKTAETTEQVTKAAAEKFAQLADLLRAWKTEPHRAAHFLIRVLFCLFAEDVGLLPSKILTELIENARLKPKLFAGQLRQLFAAMASGGPFGRDVIAHFNGGLFDSDEALELDSEALGVLRELSRLEWAYIEPSIFGTLFERSLDPSKRAQLGAHYTSRDDILLIVEPVLMAPLRRQWADVKEQAEAFTTQRARHKGGKAREKWDKQLVKLFSGFLEELRQVTVLDPACGSGNFLYVSLRLLLDLEKEVITHAGDLGLTRFFPQVSPAQLYGIEVNPYAHELAQVTVWIGYIQWLRENGFGYPEEPILKPLKNIELKDAILAFDAAGQPVEPEWPSATVIVGNPPFLGGSKFRRELGDEYSEALWKLYSGSLPATSDLVCYWFERAREIVVSRYAKRVGLLATNSIRDGFNRRVLERIKKSGDLFMAWSDRDWILDGASVRVSMIGFDNGNEKTKVLDGGLVGNINADLTASINLTQAARLAENSGLAYSGTKKYGSFELEPSQALAMLSDGNNPNGKPNSDVVKPWANGLSILRGNINSWIIDFGIDTPLEDAKQYSKPFEHVLRLVKPYRDGVRRAKTRDRWWLFEETRPGLRNAIRNLKRFMVTPMIAKHRVFVWLRHPTIPDQKLIVIARSDDYFLGVLSSSAHLLWALNTGSTLEDRPTYTHTATFETYPFPWPPGQEPKDDPIVHAIADAARELVAWRDAWLNPPGANDSELKKRTLTNLYNARPPELATLHAKLDAAVFAAYGWPPDLSDDDILARLLALNLERAAAGGVVGGGAEGDDDE